MKFRDVFLFCFVVLLGVLIAYVVHERFGIGLTFGEILTTAGFFTVVNVMREQGEAEHG